MDRVPLVLYLALLLDSVLSSLPVPVNVNVNSVNFHHVLRWDPGHGTPAGTQYKINRRISGHKHTFSSYSNTTSFKLIIPDNNMHYILTVQAFYNHTLSQESNKVTFCSLEQTIIGPPNVSLTGCGNCIHVNISLPEADQSSGIKDIKKFFSGSQFAVYWKKQNGTEESAKTPNKTYTVKNLQVGTEYCVQVYPKINVNRNTKPSAWNCTFTSIVEPSRDPAFSGAVTALLMVIGVLMSSMFFLCYTGFICNLKAVLPRVLNVRHEVLSQASNLTPERIIPDKISIGAEMEKRTMHHNPPAPQTNTRTTDSYEEEEDDEEEGENVYIDRDAELSSGASSCRDSVEVAGTSTVSGISGRHGGLDQNKAQAEGAEVSFMPEGPGTSKEEEEEEKEEVVLCESFGNINLFSVTLAALAVCKGGEQNRKESLSDFLKLSDLESLLPTKSKQTLNHTDLLTESDNWATGTLMLPPQGYGYEGRCLATSSGCLSTCDGEMEEEEEEFSGYMGH